MGIVIISSFLAIAELVWFYLDSELFSWSPNLTHNTERCSLIRNEKFSFIYLYVQNWILTHMDERDVNGGWQHLVEVGETISKFWFLVVRTNLAQHIIGELSQRFVEIWCAEESLKLIVVQWAERPLVWTESNFIFTFLLYWCQTIPIIRFIGIYWDTCCWHKSTSAAFQICFWDQGLLHLAYWLHNID